jgi:hypothetical protein
MDADGYLTVVDRKNDMIKTGGENARAARGLRAPRHGDRPGGDRYDTIVRPPGVMPKTASSASPM